MSFIHTIAAAALILGAMVPAVADDGIPAPIQQVFETYTAFPDIVLPILREAKDKESATAAAAKLNAILPQVYDIRSELQKITTLSPEVSKAVSERYGKRMRENWGEVYKEIFRLQKAQCFGSPELTEQFNLFSMMLY